MHNHLGTHFTRGEVVDTARAVRHVRQQEGERARKALDNVRNSRAVHHEALGHLERNGAHTLAPHVVNRLWDLEVVVGREGWGQHSASTGR